MCVCAVFDTGKRYDTYSGQDSITKKVCVPLLFLTVECSDTYELVKTAFLSVCVTATCSKCIVEIKLL